ncbi:transporter [Azospirillum sp.]|uniref:transporter n=1 Tax=Azospirillum sp. TaxID=34012 RepID=UPI002D5DBF48|nr:transporter [Azospirillum sp.]HYD68784.1 transporter [Azospirillum sp.]
MNTLARAAMAGATFTLAHIAALPAQASCGAAFCSVNTNWSVQSAPAESGTTLDLRFEYIPQDQPRAGSSTVGVGQTRRHHDEVKTTNRNAVATVDHAFSPNWGVSLQLPVVSRDHEHIHNHHGARLNEAWDFTKLGDARVAGRYSVTEGALAGFGVTAGLKLPTGRFAVANGRGDVAERSLQPGTGTTDLLLGAFYHQPIPEWSASWFVQASVQTPLNERQGYRPGSQFGFDVGVQYDVTERLSLLAQVNALVRGRDRGREAEPDDSGRSMIALSPGVSYAVLDNVSLYGFVQLPVWQRVNGVQLTADWSGVLGLRTRF